MYFARTWSVPIAAAILLAWSSVQEPEPAPAGEAPKAVPGTPARHPLEGVYELRRRVVDGRAEVQPGRGYVAITRRHLLLCFAGPGKDPESPLLRAGARSWSLKGERFESVVKLGWFTDTAGKLHVEEPGTAEVRKVVIERGTLRIVQDEHNALEFERIE